MGIWTHTHAYTTCTLTKTHTQEKRTIIMLKSVRKMCKVKRFTVQMSNLHPLF